MKTKLEMAHEWVMKHDDGSMSVEVVVFKAWQYADAMQAEADNRENEEAAQRRKEIREMLNAPNTFVGREGQHFDDFCSDEIQAQRDAELYGTGFLKVTYDSDGVKYERLDPKTISVCSSNIGLDSQVLKEWQPDWSQAPYWANWWAMDEDRKCHWFSKEPWSHNGASEWVLENNGEGLNNIYSPSIHCGYIGDWRNSLRKRPK